MSWRKATSYGLEVQLQICQAHTVIFSIFTAIFSILTIVFSILIIILSIFSIFAGPGFGYRSTWMFRYHADGLQNASVHPVAATNIVSEACLARRSWWNWKNFLWNAIPERCWPVVPASLCGALPPCDEARCNKRCSSAVEPREPPWLGGMGWLTCFRRRRSPPGSFSSSASSVQDRWWQWPGYSRHSLCPLTPCGQTNLLEQKKCQSLLARAGDLN